MRVHIGAIKERRGATLSVAFEERMSAPWEHGGSLVEPVRLHAQVANSGTCFTVQGEITTAVELPCDRCLSEFEMPIELEFDEEFCPRGWSDTPSHLQTFETDDDDGADDESINVFDGDSFVLDDIVREYLVLALPPKVTCREDCKGICPVCGEDRNETTCSCRDVDIDPRMAGLAEMFDRDKRR